MNGFKGLKFKEEFLFYFIGCVVVVNAIFLGQDYCFENFDNREESFKVALGPDRYQDKLPEKVIIASKQSIIEEDKFESNDVIATLPKIVDIEKEVVIKKSKQIVKNAQFRKFALELISESDSTPEKIKIAKSNKSDSDVYTYKVGHDKKVLSSSVLSAIKREMQSKVDSKVQDKISIRQSASVKALPIVVKNSVPPKPKSPPPPPPARDEKIAFQPPPLDTVDKDDYKTAMSLMGATEEEDETISVSTIYLTALESKMGIEFTDKKIHNVEFVPDYNKDDVYMDKDGTIEISHQIRGKFATIRGTLLRNELVPVKVELVISGEEGSAEDLIIPMFSVDEFNSFIEERELTGMGGALLVKMNDYIADVEIDSKYEERLYFDDDLVVSKNIEDIRYALFIGVSPGNTMIEYLTTEEKIVKKVVGIVAGEIFYDAIELSETSMVQFELYEVRPLAKKEHMLNISEEDINYVEYNSKFSKGGLNLYEFYKPLIPYGSKNYFEFTHLGAPLLVSTWDETTVYLPSLDFITRMFDQVGIEELFGRCMVQINFPKNTSVVSVNFDGYGEEDSLFLTEKYLDSGGVVSDELTVDVTNMTLLSEFPGSISFKVVYLDKRVDIINTMCVKNSYLVEQLE